MASSWFECTRGLVAGLIAVRGAGRPWAPRKLVGVNRGVMLRSGPSQHHVLNEGLMRSGHGTLRALMITARRCRVQVMTSERALPLKWGLQLGHGGIHWVMRMDEVGRTNIISCAK